MCIHMLEHVRLNLELGLNVHNKYCQIHMLFLLGDYRLSFISSGRTRASSV